MKNVNFLWLALIVLTFVLTACAPEAPKVSRTFAAPTPGEISEYSVDIVGSYNADFYVETGRVKYWTFNKWNVDTRGVLWSDANCVPISDNVESITLSARFDYKWIWQSHDDEKGDVWCLIPKGQKK